MRIDFKRFCYTNSASPSVYSGTFIHIHPGHKLFLPVNNFIIQTQIHIMSTVGARPQTVCFPVAIVVGQTAIHTVCNMFNWYASI
jgi:hypothetical protein